MAKKNCPTCHGTGIASVTTVYHPVTGKPIRKTNNPCTKC